MKNMVSIFTTLLLGCTIKYPENTPKMFDIPAPEYVLEYPTFPVVRSGKNIQEVAEKILKESIQFTKSEKLSSPEVCATEVPYTRLPQKFADISAFAKVSSAHLSEIYAETVARVKKRRPEFAQFVDILNKNKATDLENVETGVLWGVTEIIAKQYCNDSSSKHRASLILAMVHWASSDEAIYSTFFKGFGQANVMSGADLYWFRHATLESTLIEQISQLQSTFTSKPEDFYVSTNATISLSAGTIPVKCNSEVSISAVRSPNLTSSGPLVNKDSQFYMQMTCKNTSDTQMLMSESIVKVGTQDSCLFDPSNELVFPELNPNEEATVNFGPFLLTQDCADTVNIRYKLSSTHYASDTLINFTIQPVDARLELKVPTIDQDMPGHSKSVSAQERGIGQNKALELLLSASLDPSYRLYFRSFTPLPVGTEVSSPFESTELGQSFTKFLKQNSTFTLYNDIDLNTIEDTQWEKYLKERKLYSEKQDTIFTKVPDIMWFETSLTYLSSCEATAAYLVEPVGSLFKLICEDVSYNEFNSWITDLYGKTCSSQTIREQLMTLEKNRQFQASVEGKVSAKLQEMGTNESKEDKSETKAVFSRNMFIDPDYADVIKAIDTLLVNNVISASDLAIALKYADEMKYLPYKVSESFSREIARQLVMAAALVEITLNILGDGANLSSIPIYKKGAAISITELESILLDIQLSKSLAEQKNITSSTTQTRNMLQETLLKLVAEDECSSKSPLPANPPREIRTVSRYFTLPLK